MSVSEESEELAIRLAFLQRYLDDRSEGKELAVREYEKAYPGYERVVAEEIEKLRSAGDPDGEIATSRYRKLDEVGRGGMGVVWRVWDEELQRELAMKVMRGHEDGRLRAHVRQRFLAEARTMGALQHPGVVPVHALGGGDGEPFFTMPLVRGIRFSDVIERVHEGDGRWTLSRALEVLVRVCETIEFAHEQGVVHRDLKPDNVMVGRFGEVYVMDWGLAHGSAADEPAEPAEPADAATTLPYESPVLTQPGDVIGTPAYMAPEQAREGATAVDARADVYSVGAMLYHLLAGVMPYGRDHARWSSQDVLSRLRQDGPIPVAEQGKDVPPELAAICDRAIARQVDERYPTAAALGAELRAFLESRVVRAYESGALAEARKWIRRNKALAAASVIAILALTAGLVMSLAERDRANEQTARAEASSGLAQRAIHDMLEQLGETDMLGIASLTVLRKSLLQQGLESQLEFLELRGEDPTAREAVVRANAAVVKTYRLLGSYDPGIEAAKTALGQLAALKAQELESDEIRAYGLQLRTDLGVLYDRKGEADAAMREFERACEDADELLRRRPGDPSFLSRKALALTEMATCASNRREYAESLEPRRAAIAIFRSLSEHGHETYEENLALALANEGTTLIKMGEHARAEKPLRAAIDLLAARLGEDDENGSLRHKLAMAYNALQFCCARAGRDDEARRLLDKAIAMRRALVDRFPDIPVYRRELAAAVHSRGMLLASAEDHAGARDAFLEAVREQEKAIAAAPDNATAKRFLVNHRSGVCTMALRAGDHRACAAHASLLAGAPGVPPERPAAYLSQCLELVERDGALSETERAQLRRRYASEAIRLLRGAVAAGFRAAGALRGRAFKPLRENAEFRRIFDDLRRERGR